MGWRSPRSGLRTGSLSVFDTWAADRQRWVTGGEAGGEPRYPRMAQGYQLKKTADWGPGAASHVPRAVWGGGAAARSSSGEAMGRQALLECKEEFFNKAF